MICAASKPRKSNKSATHKKPINEPENNQNAPSRSMMPRDATATPMPGMVLVEGKRHQDRGRQESSSQTRRRIRAPRLPLVTVRLNGARAMRSIQPRYFSAAVPRLFEMPAQKRSARADFSGKPRVLCCPAANWRGNR